MDPTLQGIYQAVLEGDLATIQSKVKQALAAGATPATILNDSMIPAITEVGRKFQCGEYFLPEMMVAAKSMKAGLTLIKPLLTSSEVKTEGKVIAGTVQGDLHDIGKTLVCMMLEGAGFEIEDLGADVPPEKFVEAVRAGNPDILAMSALLTTTMPSMQTTIQALQAAGLRDHIKVIVGGAPLTNEYAQRIGADGYAPDASRAVALAKTLAAAH